MKRNFKNLLKNFEKVLKKYSRYLFRYLLLGFSGALGRSQMQKRAKKWAQMLSKAPKIPQSKIHVAVVKSTNNVVESSKSPVITGFFAAPKTSEYTLDTFLDTFP